MGKERLEFFDFDADLRLSNRTIQFTPVKYLVPIAEKYPELKEQFELARTDSEQIKIGLGVGLILKWYTLVKEVATILKEDLMNRDCSSFGNSKNM